MKWRRPPFSVLVLACLYIGVGTIGFAAHFRELLARQHDAALIELTEMVAVVCGVSLLQGHNWARWLALAWIAFHVVLSAFHSFGELAIHALFCAMIAWLLFGPEGARYFRSARIEST